MLDEDRGTIKGKRDYERIWGWSEKTVRYYWMEILQTVQDWRTAFGKWGRNPGDHESIGGRFKGDKQPDTHSFSTDRGDTRTIEGRDKDEHTIPYSDSNSNDSLLSSPLGSDELSSRKQGEKQGSKKNATAEDIRLARLLADLIRANDTGAKEPKVEKWAEDIEKCRRIDKRSYDEIERLIRWSQADPFWRSNILSAKKFREQFGRLKLQSEAKASSQQARTPSSDTSNLWYIMPYQTALAEAAKLRYDGLPSSWARFTGPDGKVHFVKPEHLSRPIPESYTRIQ